MSNALRLACTSVPGNLPVMHTGAIPRAPLTRSAPNAYIVNPSEAHKYDLAGTERRPALMGPLAGRRNALLGVSFPAALHSPRQLSVDAANSAETLPPPFPQFLS